MAELFKFRCFQCQKLLGAPPSRIGSATTCPKCGAGLIVPPPLEAGPDPESDDPDSAPIRLEDLGLRLEPEPSPAAAAQPSASSPVAFLNDPDYEPEPPAEDRPALDGPDEPLTTPLAAASSRRGVGGRGREPAGRARDVVLPRTAAIAWSLFALLALAAAFAAGLLVGHYRWR